MADTTEDNIPNLLFNEVEPGEITLAAVTAFVIQGAIMVVFSMITLWLVIGYFVRFNNKFKNENLLKSSVIIALIWAYINGFSRIFLNTNLIVNNTTILQFRFLGIGRGGNMRGITINRQQNIKYNGNKTAEIFHANKEYDQPT